VEISPGGRKGSLFRDAVTALREAGVDSPALDASVLLGYVTDDPSPASLRDSDARLTPAQAQLYVSLIKKRCLRIPVSRLMGRREFFSRDFEINSDVLDPRPDTETLVEEAVLFLRAVEGIPEVLDVGTGSGAVALTLACEDPRVRVTATDISLRALAVAIGNARRHAVLDRLRFVGADLTQGLRVTEVFDLIVSNPPYISREQYGSLQEEVRNGDPELALLSGREGTEFYEPLASGAIKILKPGGSLMVEVGAGQDQAVSETLENAGFQDVQVVNDLAGIGRVVKGRKEIA